MSRAAAPPVKRRKRDHETGLPVQAQSKKARRKSSRRESESRKHEVAEKKDDSAGASSEDPWGDSNLDGSVDFHEGDAYSGFTVSRAISSSQRHGSYSSSTAETATIELDLLLGDLFPHGIHESHIATREKCRLLIQVTAWGVPVPSDVVRPLFDRLLHPETPYRLSLFIYQTLRQILAINPGLWVPHPQDWQIFLHTLTTIAALEPSRWKQENQSLQHEYPLRKAVLLFQCFVSAFQHDIDTRQRLHQPLRNSLLAQLIFSADRNGPARRRIFGLHPPNADKKLMDFILVLFQSLDRCEAAVENALTVARSSGIGGSNSSLLELMVMTVSGCIDTLKICVSASFPSLGY